MKTALYRHFDRAGRLLYVGVSLSAFQRTRQHGQNAAWFEEVETIKIEWHATRSAAETAEYQAIRNEKPLHNQTFNRKAAVPEDLIIVLGDTFQPLSNAHSMRRVERPLSRRQLAQQRAENVAKRRKSA